VGRVGAIVMILVLAVAVGFVVLYWRDGDRAGAATPAANHSPTDLPPGVVDVPEAAQKNAGLRTLTVGGRVLPATIEVTGVVAPDERRVSHVRPLARGVIEDIPVTLGARVAQGQTLLSYDNIELGALVGDYLSEVAAQHQAEADLEVKQRSVERAEELIKLEAVAMQTLELRRAEFKNAQASVASQRARVAKIEEQIHRFGLSDADLTGLTPEEGRSGHRTASHSVLRAPFAGVVTKFDIAPGELVEPERELMTLTDLSTLWVLADVYEKDLAKVRVDTDVNIRVDAYPDRIFVGRLTYIGDSIDPQTRTAKVRCVIANPDGALKLDMFVKVSVPTNDKREVLTVPAAALQQIDGQSVVFVRQSPSRFERRNVEVGRTAGDVVEIRSGLRAGEVIAGAGSFYLKTALLRETIGDEG
jgi:cobalt-zinc-cadmium efflux system membrane fusion protein